MGEGGGGGTYDLKTTSRRSRRSVESQKNATKIVSFLSDVPEQSITNFNGNGGEHSQSEKRRVEGHRAVKAPKE